MSRQAGESAAANLILELDYPKIDILNSVLERSLRMRGSRLDFPRKGRDLPVGLNEPEQWQMDALAQTAAAEDRTASEHSMDSSLREQAIGHIFLGQLLAHMWCAGKHDIEVLKAEVDRYGYDVVLESDGILRHVQLKSRFRDSTVSRVDVNTKLLAKPGGCVIWVEFDPKTLQLERFYWFGGAAGTPLPALGNKASKHSKGNSQGDKLGRPLHRVLGKGRFDAMDSIELVAKRLFG